MSGKINFFRGIFLLFKKDVRLYCKKAVSWLILLTLLAGGTLLALGAMMQNAQSTGEKVIRMAIYDREPSAQTSNAIYAVSKLKSVSEIFSIKMCDSEADVRGGMKSGVYDAALIFEDGYFTKILDGDDSAVTILVSDKLSALTDIIKHFAKTGEKLIRSAEAGIEGLYSPLKEAYPSNSARKILNEIEAEFALKLFALPENAFDVTTVLNSASGVGKIESYALCYTVFLLLVCEVIFFSYTAKDCRSSMLRRIKSYRIGNLSIAVEKAVLPFLIRIALVAGLLAVFNGIWEINLSFAAVIFAILCILLLSIIMSSVSVLLSASPLGISVIFALCAANLVLCGGIVPCSMMPHAVSVAARYTPIGIGTQMLSPLFFGSCGASAPIMLTVTAVTATAFAVLRLCHLAKGGDER